jgi:hypothetical protein
MLVVSRLSCMSSSNPPNTAAKYSVARDCKLIRLEEVEARRSLQKNDNLAAQDGGLGRGYVAVSEDRKLAQCLTGSIILIVFAFARAHSQLRR